MIPAVRPLWNKTVKTVPDESEKDYLLELPECV